MEVVDARLGNILFCFCGSVALPDGPSRTQLQYTEPQQARITRTKLSVPNAHIKTPFIQTGFFSCFPPNVAILSKCHKMGQKCTFRGGVRVGPEIKMLERILFSCLTPIFFFLHATQLNDLDVAVLRFKSHNNPFCWVLFNVA